MNVSFAWNVTLGDEEDIEVLVEAEITPGCKATGPSYSGGGEPADPGECEITSVLRADAKQPVELLPAIRAADDKDHAEWAKPCGEHEPCATHPRTNEPRITREERLIEKAYEAAAAQDEPHDG